MNDWTYPNTERLDIAVFGHANGRVLECYCLWFDVKAQLKRRNLWPIFVDAFRERKCRVTPRGDFWASDVEAIIWAILPKA